MHDPGPFWIGAGRKRVDVVEERVYEGLVFVAVPGMDDESSRFVDDDHVIVFKNDIQRNVLSRQVDFLNLWGFVFENISLFEPIMRLTCFAVQKDLSLFEKGFGFAPTRYDA